MLKKILVIDDEHRIVEICRDYLQAAGFEVLSASDGLGGLAAIRREMPDLLILDVKLSDMDGFELCHVLHDNFNLPIVILTSQDSAADKLLGLKLGADDYITKPFSPRELVARVQMILRRVDKMSFDAIPDKGYPGRTMTVPKTSDKT